ncbi:hypothetical protein GPECTOR_1g842 [Gonium pectorale]|uniref:Nudix hydrolase domain-containing protein n=1 Tax=Gonium pectorale TaxID=33097 RepID=A0A150H4D7_GONPE|nr:hypothetical protein GPECTOR_1g842 [Gonium pectorale]|eukprot:KXZ56934.1 hypothetical protein GPECTOR_1g842 [Gonium pectorale]
MIDILDRLAHVWGSSVIHSDDLFRLLTRYPRPAVTVDTVVVSRPSVGAPAQLLLIKRKNAPFKDCWALPGGFVDEGEGLDTAAARELHEETSVDPATVSLTQVGAFGDPGRDPRGWTVTVAYAALVPTTNLGVKAADDAKDARWFDVSSLPQLAFDHKLVVRSSLRHLAKQPAAAALARLRYARPALTVDTVVVAQPDGSEPAQLLLIKRKLPPFKDCWALPGGFVDEGEGLDTAAARELQEETSVEPSSVSLTQVGAFGDPGRDPRGWTVTVAYAALVPTTDLGVKAADDAKDARWFDVSSLPQLAFDHKLVVRSSLRHLAKQPAAAALANLPEDLLRAADKLEGPWQTQP